ncbi:MAG TPA: hypothetical protein VJ718_10585 [Candidatus Binataceae bacterium]|nr:hypothetical protein [Candidatus Binataceae bacterium]
MNASKRRRARTPFYGFIAIAAIVVLYSAPFAAHAASPALDGPASRMFWRLAQNNVQGDEGSVPADKVEKYIAVYKAMQRNRGVTVEKAAAAQGMTVEQFRELENRVQRDDAAMQHVRDELQSAAARSPASSATH